MNRRIINDFLDKATGFFIICSLIWAPWAYGTVHKNNIIVLTAINYLTGILFIIKRLLLYKNDYPSNKLPQYYLKRRKVLAFAIVFLILYVIISLCNPKANFNTIGKYFDYYPTTITWLPSTFDQNTTLIYLTIFVSCIFSFLALKDWLLPIDYNQLPQYQSRAQIFTSRIKTIVGTLALNSFLLCATGYLTKMLGSQHNNSIFFSFQNGFASFIYRSNACSYLNIILSIMLCILFDKSITVTQNKFRAGNKIENRKYFLIALCLLITAVPFVTNCRAGCIITVLIILFWLSSNKEKDYHLFKSVLKKKKFLIPLIPLSLVSILCIGSVTARFNSSRNWIETNCRSNTTSDQIILKLNIPITKYEKGTRLFLLTDSKSEKFRSYTYSAFISKFGSLDVVIYDDKKNSSITLSHENFQNNLIKGSNLLQLNRSETFITTINGKRLDYKYIDNGQNPPPVNHPLQLSNLMLFSGAKLADDQAALKIESFIINNIEPNVSEAKKTIFNYRRNVEGLQIMAQQLLGDRFSLYKNSVKQLWSTKIWGSGLGTWNKVYLLYKEPEDAYEAWAHNDPIEIISTLGVLGTGTFLIIILLIFYRSKTNLLPTVFTKLRIGCQIGGISCVFHSLIDFPFQVLSILHLFTVVMCMIYSIDEYHITLVSKKDK